MTLNLAQFTLFQIYRKKGLKYILRNALANIIIYVTVNPRWLALPKFEALMKVSLLLTTRLVIHTSGNYERTITPEALDPIGLVLRYFCYRLSATRDYSESPRSRLIIARCRATVPKLPFQPRGLGTTSRGLFSRHVSLSEHV
ncbi:hypothetical protein RRF57_004994 [Xylaria bambusicola]|uniref:Uncharacterized protein n=1 Tax=Xylaria bambusicola TaxID=326684 RepID=A0AAN7UP70_9PEZI